MGRGKEEQGKGWWGVGLLALLWSVLIDPGEVGGDVPGLDPDFALSGEAAHESFAAEEESFETAAAQAGQHGDVVLQGIFEGNDKAGVDDIVVLDVDFEDCAVGVEEDISVAGGF